MRLPLAIADILFPDRCVECNRIISYGENGLCPDCMRELRSDFFLDENLPVSEWDDRQRPVNVFFDHIQCLGSYKGVLQKLICSIKFENNRRPAYLLSDQISDKLLKSFSCFDIITAVPLSKKRKNLRGFNQSALIAERIAKRLDKPYMMILKECRDAEIQSQLPQRMRFFNAWDRYAIHGEIDLKGKVILIIDDVFTTGATLNECSRLLKMGGALAVYAFAVAKA